MLQLVLMSLLYVSVAPASLLQMSVFYGRCFLIDVAAVSVVVAVFGLAVSGAALLFLWFCLLFLVLLLLLFSNPAVAASDLPVVEVDAICCGLLLWIVSVAHTASVRRGEDIN